MWYVLLKINIEYFVTYSFIIKDIEIYSENIWYSIKDLIENKWKKNKIIHNKIYLNNDTTKDRVFGDACYEYKLSLIPVDCEKCIISLSYEFEDYLDEFKCKVYLEPK